MDGPASTLHLLAALERGDLAGTRELRLPGLAAFPRAIFGLADSLEVLDLSGGPLNQLPDDLGRLSKLRSLFCSGTRFDRLPPVLGDCQSLSQVGFRGAGVREVPGEALPRQLRWLTLTDNVIERLPAELGSRPALQKLMLAGNRLDGLPPSLADASGLELIRIAANRLDALPSFLVDLPRLAWLAWAGNPLEGEPLASGRRRVAWADLEIGELLGEGASGRVHRAVWRAEARPVALKLFKGAMTSDGLPEREMAACLAAGEHPNLTGGLASLEHHPEGSQGLLMPLLPAHWRVLAGPPSLASCTRDVYDPALRLAPGTALTIAAGVAAAVAHLHARNLLHGDVYAHNILWDGSSGQAVLSDFGAASILPHGTDKDGLVSIEVRAFGLLLGELLSRCGIPPAAGGPLDELAHACAQPDPKARPTMAEVLSSLERLRAARHPRRTSGT
jgi:hypothetical protein